MDIDVILFEGLAESFGHAIGFGLLTGLHGIHAIKE
jgi:hypothetical protein